MNKRDVIVIAVLINAGLLIVLFTSALKSDHTEPVMVMQQQMNPSPLPSKGDEVDRVLSQFVAISPVAESVKEGSALQAIATQTPSQNSSCIQIDSEEPAPLVFKSTVVETPKESHFLYKEIKVKKGDALEKIARANHTTVQEIMRDNKLSSTQLKIGQVLKISSQEGKSEPIKNHTSNDAGYYIVKNGDTPWTIAVKNHMKVEELLKLNSLDEDKARKIKPGDQLRTR